MTRLTIITDTLGQAKEIVQILLKEKFALEVNIVDNCMDYKMDKKGNIIEKSIVTLICTTKSLLFPTIDNLLKEKYPDNMPVLYSLPIIHMDWEQSKILVNKTKNV